MSFFLFYFILELYQKSQIPSLQCFYLCFHCILLFLFFIFFSFHSLKLEELLTYTRKQTGKVSIVSCPCGFDPFSLYAITDVSRKLKCTHFNFWFQNDTFCARFTTIKFWRRCRGWERFNFTSLLTFLLCFLVCRLNFSIAEVHTCSSMVG